MGAEGKKGPATPELRGFIPSDLFLNAYSTNLRTGGKLRVPLVKRRRDQNPGQTPGGLPVTLSSLMFVSSSHVMISRSKKIRSEICSD